MRVVVAGAGIAGAEALLALRELAGDRVSLTLVSPNDQLVLPALTVAEVFARGRAPSYALEPLLSSVGAEHVKGSLDGVAPGPREIRLDDGRGVAFDALLLAVGGRPVARVERATTWWPTGGADEFAALLRDLEEGYTKRVAFVIPPGAVWPLPLYELALMTARQVRSMGMDDVQLTVITPEALPLSLFGCEASLALGEELERVGIALESAAMARIESAPELQVLIQPSERRLKVDRVVALPGVEGPRIPGTTQDDAGFIRVTRNGQMRDSDSVWAAGDAIAYPVKFGGLATQQADMAAIDIAARAGAGPPPAETTLSLRGVLMTGAAPRVLGGAPAPRDVQQPIWHPEGKVLGRYLTPYLEGLEGSPPRVEDGSGVPVEETLPGPEHGEERAFTALWRPEQSSPDYLRRLGRHMRAYEARHRQASAILREHGALRGRRG